MYSGILREANANASSLPGSIAASANTRDASLDPQIGQERSTRFTGGTAGRSRALLLDHVARQADLALADDAPPDEMRPVLHLLEDLGDVLADQRDRRDVDRAEEDDR